MATKTETKNGNGLHSTCYFKLRNETPGAVRYEQIDADGKPFTIAMGALVGTLYLRKAALNIASPKRLKIDINTQPEE